MEKETVRYEDVKRLFGDITDHKAAEILDSGLPISELEKISILLAGDDDHTLDMGRLTPEAQNLFLLLRSDDENWEADRT